MSFIERKSRYWIVARAGVKTTELFAKATKTAWQWAKTSQYIRWFTDGERRYQGNRRIEWVKPEHPYTAISDKGDVQANHNEANNSALRRRCSAYRRRQNLYAKNTERLQRTVTVQQLVHNWVRPHVGLGKTRLQLWRLGYIIDRFLCWSCYHYEAFLPSRLNRPVPSLIWEICDRGFHL